MADTTVADSGFGYRFPSPDGYKLRARTGKSARSQWYAAVQTRLDRLVAVKYLMPTLAESEDFREIFLEAGRQAAGIVHPAAVPVINVFPSALCIAMQWCRGESLRDLKTPLEPARAARVGEVVMDCLSSLHATGRCHGNLSPGNIFLGEGRAVWVEDFFHPPMMHDGERVFLAEQRFIAPETLNTGQSDWLSDVYSLGRVLAGAVDRAGCSEELGMLLEGLQSEDPTHRGGAPGAVLDAFRRVRRLEEVRVGCDPTGTRRKRMYRRVPAEFDVSLRRRSATPEETAVILMKTRDIGESGVFVETDDEMLVVGSILELDFTLKGIAGNVHAFGVVRWRSYAPMPKGVGVQFVEVDQEGLVNLRKFLGSRQ